MVEEGELLHIEPIEHGHAHHLELPRGGLVRRVPKADVVVVVVAAAVAAAAAVVAAAAVAVAVVVVTSS